MSAQVGRRPRENRPEPVPRLVPNGRSRGYDVGDDLAVVLGDDQQLFVDALSVVLRDAGHRVHATATTGRELVDSVQAIQPDVCITEMSFADADGHSVVRAVHEASPNTLIIMLTADTDACRMREALSAGARGYVHKSRDTAVVLDVIRRVQAGEVVVQLTRSAQHHVPRRSPHDIRLLADHLTARELQCLRLLAGGSDTGEIARALGVSQATVRSHVQGILTKLGAHSRLEAASLAIRHGLVDEPTDRAHPHW